MTMSYYKYLQNPDHKNGFVENRAYSQVLLKKLLLNLLSWFFQYSIKKAKKFKKSNFFSNFFAFCSRLFYKNRLVRGVDD